MFDGDREPPTKPPHFFSKGMTSQELVEFRRQYDEYVAYADAEFGRLYRSLESSGVLDDTCLIVTSDHGEMFERGIAGHITQTLFEPVIRIPLLISKPGQRQREDVYTATSAVDLLPTLADLAGQPVPAWCEGRILPTADKVVEAQERPIYVLEAKQNLKLGPLTMATAALLKDGFKLIHYRGYEGYAHEYELFDLNNDPEELENLYGTEKSVAEELRAELLTALQQAAPTPLE
jgi:arylsulfatase A-like enzyme